MKRILSLFFILCLFSLIACATFIQMKVTLNIPQKVGGTQSYVNVSLVNQGDEPAHDVRLELILPQGFSADSKYIGLMRQDHPTSAVFNVSLPSSFTEGMYPIVLKTHYADANAYPFSTITAGLMRIGQSRSSLIRGRMKPAIIYGESPTPLTLEILNRGSSPQRVNVRFILPEEIKSSVYETEVHVPAQDTATQNIVLENFGALPESTYFMMAVIEYEDDYHFSSISSAKIQVKQEKTMVSPTTYMVVFFGLMIIVVAGFVYMQFHGAKPQKKKKDKG